MTEDKPSKPWDGIITEEEKRIYAAAGFGRPSGTGCRPADLAPRTHVALHQNQKGDSDRHRPSPQQREVRFQ